MNIYEEFTNDDLKQFLKEKGFIRQCKRAADEREVIDYEKLSNLLGCKPRQARNLVDGKLPLQRGQYNLLALHSGAARPQLVSAQTLVVPCAIDEGSISGYIKQDAVDLFISKHLEPDRSV